MVATLYVAQDVLIPIVLATILSFVLSPIVNIMERGGVSRTLSVAVTVLLAFCLILLAGTLIARQASTLAADAPRYAATIQQKLENLQAFATSRLEGFASSLGLAPSSPAAPGSPTVAISQPTSLPAGPAPPPTVVATGAVRSDTSPVAVARSLLAPVLGPIETTVIVLVIAIFILMEREDVRDRFIRLAGARDLHRTTAAMDDAAARLSRYFVSQLAVNATFGTVIGFGLWMFGVPSPALWGVVAGLLRFIPYIGPILAAIAPLALALAVDTGWRTAVEVAFLFIVVEPVVGYVVEPLLYGHSTGLAPIAVIVAAVFWTWLWGPVGLIISTPLTLCLVVMGRHVKSLEFFDVLLGDRPALTPADTFYQRMLAGDPDEALERAEAVLQQQSLLDYYDEIVLQALKRAVEDESRGAMTADGAVSFSRMIMEVLSELGERVHSRSAQAGSKAAADDRPVACVSGRGPFDDAVSAMLMQLLAHRRVRARLVPHVDVSRERIGQCQLADAKAIIVSYLDIEGASSQIKYLVRRLRQHAPGTRIILGLWPDALTVAADRTRLEEIGADAYVGSLRDALEQATGES